MNGNQWRAGRGGQGGRGPPSGPTEWGASCNQGRHFPLSEHLYSADPDLETHVETETKDNRLFQNIYHANIMVLTSFFINKPLQTFVLYIHLVY